MVELKEPGFLVGEMAWLSDGQSGRIAGGNYNPTAGEWLWAFTTPGGPFRESDLYHFDPTAQVPLALPEFPAAGEVVSPDDLREAIGSVVALIEALPLGMPSEAVREMVDSSAESVIQAAEAFTVGETNRRAESLASVISDTAEALNSQLGELESTVVPALSQLESRLSSLETAAEEASGMSIGDFFRGLGSFLASPFAFVIEKSRDAILAEVKDGLTR